jgi:hypothetical protein
MIGCLTPVGATVELWVLKLQRSVGHIAGALIEGADERAQAVIVFMRQEVLIELLVGDENAGTVFYRLVNSFFGI